MTMDDTFFTHMMNMYKTVRPKVAHQPDVCFLLDDMIDQLSLYRMFGDSAYLAKMKVCNQKLKQRVVFGYFE